MDNVCFNSISDNSLVPYVSHIFSYSCKTGVVIWNISYPSTLIAQSRCSQTFFSRLYICFIQNFFFCLIDIGLWCCNTHITTSTDSQNMVTGHQVQCSIHSPILQLGLKNASTFDCQLCRFTLDWPSGLDMHIPRHQSWIINFRHQMRIPMSATIAFQTMQWSMSSAQGCYTFYIRLSSKAL